MDTELAKRKRQLLDFLIKSGFLKTKPVIDAFKDVPRENFVPDNLKRNAYINEPIPIGHGQTISQPLTVAVMTEALDAKPGQKILEVGAGSGYQAALLSKIVRFRGKIVATERIKFLAKLAQDNMRTINCKNIHVVEWDGSKGYQKEAPFDRIIVTASAPNVPKPLIEQLKPGGKMVIPVGNEMWLIEKLKTEKGAYLKKTMLGYYVFVPLIGEHGYGEQ